jgi:CheY-like chemotaxis protein
MPPFPDALLHIFWKHPNEFAEPALRGLSVRRVSPTGRNFQGPTMPRSSLSPIPSNLPDVAERRALQLLVVDDDATQRSLITVAAKQAGHEVAVAPSVAEAIEKLRAARFDCVTLDLVLEDGDGIDVLREMAAAKFSGSVIVISGMDGKRRSGARSFARSVGIELQSLPKPLDLAALRISLANLGKTAMGLPTIHTWGGVATDAIVERHRA